MKTLSVKILRCDKNGHKAIKDLLKEFQAMLDGGGQYSISYHGSLSVPSIKGSLTKNYGSDVESRDGVYEGCYGSSSGKPLEGFKVYIDSSLFEDRFLDSGFDEIINIEQLCEKYGEKLDIDPEAFRESMYAMNIEGKSDNTYNYLGHDRYSPTPLCHANFELFKCENEEEEKTVIIVKFHCGGDVRGNYSNEVVYAFSDFEESYNAFRPSLYLLDENNIDEIERLKDLISNDPENKEVLIKELRELFNE